MIWPDSGGAGLLEFNQCHDPRDGRFCATPGAERLQRPARAKLDAGRT
jgi:hypothetical protein